MDRAPAHTPTSSRTVRAVLAATAIVIGAVLLASPAHAADAACDTAYVAGPTGASSSGICGSFDHGRVEANVGITFQEPDPAGYRSCDAKVRVRLADRSTAFQNSFDCLGDAQANGTFFRSTVGHVRPACVPGADIYVESVITGTHVGGSFQSTPAVYIDVC